ncbi:hypothetical protein CLOLEP_03875 [[Clostridium] leptum DSM 753]|uniref:Uncharacterized protein n=1 Tax=[Clostridium] leptum DSM 753 TaxID=428125 RepID=A7VZ46_9FIRM|nr:hypothetical protein CLOLEP_03875 [[Clostridium] leptum DSM 753]
MSLLFRDETARFPANLFIGTSQGTTRAAVFFGAGCSGGHFIRTSRRPTA